MELRINRVRINRARPVISFKQHEVSIIRPGIELTIAHSLVGLSVALLPLILRRVSHSDCDVTIHCCRVVYLEK